MSPKRIRALERGLMVIEALSQSGALTLSQLRHKTQLDNATLLRIIATLVERGWVRQLLVEKKYELTYSLGKLLGKESRAHPIAELSVPILLGLKDNVFQMPSDLCAIVGDGLFEVVESTRSKGPMAQQRTGLRLRPSLFRSAHGRTILTALSPEKRKRHVNAFLQRASKEDVAWHAAGNLEKEMRLVQAQNYALREKKYWEPPFDETPEFGAIAVTIENQTGVYGSLSLLWLEDDIGLEDVLKAGLLDDLTNAAQAIATRLADNDIAAPQ